jgi:ATP-dependent Clp protease ATP-binding subunit ClpC
MLRSLLFRIFGSDHKHPLGTKKRMERFTQRARRVLSLAQEEAEHLRHSYIGTEHMLLGLMREEGGVAGRVLRDLGVEYRRLEELVEELTPATERKPSTSLSLAPATKRVLELSVDEARRMGHHYIGTEHLLLGLVRQPEGVAIDVFKRLGVSPEEVRRQTRRVLQESPVITTKSAEDPLTPMPGQVEYHPAEPATGNIQQIRLVIKEKTSGEVKTDLTLPAKQASDALSFIFARMRENRGGSYAFSSDDFSIQVDLLYGDEGKEDT